MSVRESRGIAGHGQYTVERQTASAPVSPRVHSRDFGTGIEKARLQYGYKSGPGSRTPGTPNYHTSERSSHPDASLVLVGIRGCGKRSLGFIAATALGRRFITEDHYFQTVTGLSRQDYLKLHGSEEFHKHDVEISRSMLEDNKVGCVIDCGLGSLTSGLQEYLKVYSLTNPVIYIIRDMNQISRLLRLSERSARLLESGDPTHRKCSNYEYYNLEDVSAQSDTGTEGLDRGLPTYSFKLRDTQADFSYFVKFVTGLLATTKTTTSPFLLDPAVDSRLYTYALQIPFSTYTGGKVELTSLESGGDVAEIVIDQWPNGSYKTLSRLVADIRRSLRVPVLISVAWRSIGLTLDTYISILRHCLRLAVEYLSVDLDLGQQHITELLSNKGPTRCIATTTLSTSTPEQSVWLNGTATSELKLASSLKFDIVRLTYAASSRNENESVQFFKQILQRQESPGPSVIAYNTGALGRTSQVFNQVLTPVTHDALKSHSISAIPPPLLTAQQCMSVLFSSFVLDPLHFTIIGSNVTKSLSPAMHNAAYRLLGLDHKYATVNIKSWDDIDALAKDPNFGGASVVQPWKVRLATKVAHMSEHARIIGAINTLIPLRSSVDGSVPPLHVQAAQRNRAGPVSAWYGDNTDWIAMHSCIGRSLSPRNVIQQKSTGLVIGAGGMARSAVYALIQLGCKNIFVYNRTIKNAENLAGHYNKWLSSRSPVNGSSIARVRAIRSLEDLWPSEFVMPTMVISCVTHEHLDGNPDANFTMPKTWLGSESGGVVLELAYMTRETPLTTQIKEYRQATGIPWIVVDGIQALFEQALSQFEIMTGRLAPKKCMHEAVYRAIHEGQTFVADSEEYNVR